MSHEEVLKTSPEQVDDIKKSFGMKNDQIAKDVAVIRQWLEKQPHLPQKEEDKWIETMLILNKFSIEKTKKKLDMLYTVRSLCPEFFTDRTPLGPNMQKVMDVVTVCPLPQLTDDLCRVHIFHLLNSDPDLFDVNYYSKYVFLTIDVRAGVAHDFSLGEHYILDYGNAKLGHIIKTDPLRLAKAYKIVTSAYSDRIKGLHFVNLPPFANTLLTIANTILSDKLKGRVHVHSNMESLHEVINKKILPKEYGGSEKSIVELSTKWRKYIENNNDWFKTQEQRKSNEALRPEPLDNEMFGLEGSFRQLTVD